MRETCEHCGNDAVNEIRTIKDDLDNIDLIHYQCKCCGEDWYE